MQIIKKPQIDLVLKAYIQATGQEEIEQKNRYTDQLKIHRCFKKFETVNFETQNPEMKFSIPSSTITLSGNTIILSGSTSTLSGNTCTVEEQRLNLLQAAERNSLNFNLDLSEIDLQVVTGAAKHFSCPLAPDTGNSGQ